MSKNPLNNQLKQNNFDFSDGSLNKTIVHALVGGTVSAIQNKDVLTGALSAGVREAISPLSQDFSNDGKLLASQLTGIVVGGLVSGDSGAKQGYTIATSAEVYNRQMHQDEVTLIKNKIEDFKSQNNEYSDEKASKLLTLAGEIMVDKKAKENFENSKINEFTNEEVNKAIAYLTTVSQSKEFKDASTQLNQDYFTSKDYQYTDSSWNPNEKRFVYLPTNATIRQTDNEILANQITQQTWYERQKGAEERFDIVSRGGDGISAYGTKIGNPYLISLGSSISFGATTISNLVTPDKKTDSEIINSYLPWYFQLTDLNPKTEEK